MIENGFTITIKIYVIQLKLGLRRLIKLAIYRFRRMLVAKVARNGLFSHCQSVHGTLFISDGCITDSTQKLKSVRLLAFRKFEVV